MKEIIILSKFLEFSFIVSLLEKEFFYINYLTKIANDATFVFRKLI